MRDVREEAVEEIVTRIKNARELLEIRALRRGHWVGTLQSEFPVIFMSEGEDTVIKTSNRTSNEYPARRSLLVYFELIGLERDPTGVRRLTSVRDLYMKFRSVLLQPAELTNLAVIREFSTIGPLNYKMPDLFGIQFICQIKYIDVGYN